MNDSINCIHIPETWAALVRLVCAEINHYRLYAAPADREETARRGTGDQRKVGEGIQVPGQEEGRGNGWDVGRALVPRRVAFSSQALAIGLRLPNYLPSHSRG